MKGTSPKVHPRFTFIDELLWMTLRRCAIIFLLLAAAAAIVKFTMASPRTGLLIDVTFVAAVACFLACGIGYLGRRMGDVVKAAERDRHHPDQSG